MRVLCRQLFVDVDTQARLPVRPHEAVPNLRRSREYFLDAVAVNRLFLYAKVGNVQVHLQVGRLPDWRNVARPLERRSDAHQLGHRGVFPCRCDTANRRQSCPYKIDQPTGDQRYDFERVVEDLANRKRRRTLLPYALKPPGLVRRQQILEEEELERFDLFGEIDRQDCRQPLVYVVQQLHFPANARPQPREQSNGRSHVRLRLVYTGALGVGEPVIGRCRFGSNPFRSVLRVAVMTLASGSPVSRKPWRRHLHPHVVITAFDEPPGLVLDLFRRSRRGMGIYRRGLTRLAADQVVDGHAQRFTLDIPQCLVNSAQSVVQNRPAAPVRRNIRRLPDIFDIGRVFADQERAQVVFDGCLHGFWPGTERRTTESIQAGLGGLYFYDREPRPRLRLGEDRPYISNPDVAHALYPAL